MSDVSELRRDPVSGDWVVIATGRARRPADFKRHREVLTSAEICPLDEPEGSGNKVIFTHPPGEQWWVKVIENKYPMVQGLRCGIREERGPYEVQPGAGYHEVVITRDHGRSLGQMSNQEARSVVETYVQRYETLRELDCANYILIFHNHGVEAGASLSHPHSQIIGIPVVPPDIRQSLLGSQRYYEKTGSCVHCAMLEWERKEERRIIFENEHMVALSPYVPRNAFEIRIYPKVHSSFFEKISPEEQLSLAEALHEILARLYHGLSDPPYNFFIHTAPVKELHQNENYHWHVEILPQATTPPAGFELGTGIDVSVVDPDEAATYLRNVHI